MIGRLEQKSTGAASGIGRAAAVLFARKGARVLCVDRDPDVEATAAAINDAGGTALATTADLTDPEQARTATERDGGITAALPRPGT